MRRLVFTLAGALLLGATAAVVADEDVEPARTRAGLAAFQKYLKAQYPEKKWQTGPAALDSAALRAAYPGQRLYFVFTRPPLPPGANLPSIQEAYRRRLEELRRTHISLTARVDAKGNVTPLRKPEDFNTGLMKIASEEDAWTAAAAILSLYGQGQAAPGPVAPREVTVIRIERGWSCQVNRPRDFQGSVMFDARGRCTGISKAYAGPLPP